MKRAVLLIDGTWNSEAASGNTNVAKFNTGQNIRAGLDQGAGQQ